MVPYKQFDWRGWVLVLVGLGLAIYLIFHDPISQNQNYHAFADQREWLSIPHFLDVISNLPFLWIGYLGMRLVSRIPKMSAKLSWLCFFGGVFLVGPGSAYYHWNPNDWTLIWDRLPITLGFMAMLSALITETAHPKFEKFLGAFLGLGIVSVIYWAKTADLRPYVWVQGFPLIGILLVCVLYAQETKNDRLWLLGAFAAYAGAKVTEHFDSAIFESTRGIMSGHTLKHFLAALAVTYLYFMVKKRSVSTIP